MAGGGDSRDTGGDDDGGRGAGPCADAAADASGVGGPCRRAGELAGLQGMREAAAQQRLGGAG